MLMFSTILILRKLNSLKNKQRKFTSKHFVNPTELVSSFMNLPQDRAEKNEASLGYGRFGRRSLGGLGDWRGRNHRKPNFG